MRQISNLEVRKIKRLNSKKDGQKIKTRTEIRVQADAQQKGREAEALRLPRLAAHRGRKQKGEATSGTRRGRGRMSRRHRRPHPGLAAARGAARDRAAAPRAVRPPRRGHCVPADSRSRAVSQQSPVLPASPSPRSLAQNLIALPLGLAEAPAVRGRRNEKWKVRPPGKRGRSHRPQIVPSRRERSSGVCRQIIP